LILEYLITSYFLLQLNLQVFKHMDWRELKMEGTIFFRKQENVHLTVRNLQKVRLNFPQNFILN